MRAAPTPIRPMFQRGFTLLEIMIALTIGLFLLGALLTIVQTNKSTFVNQSKLAQLQDSERMALTLMADVIQMAGYFPDPTTNTASSSLIAAGAFANGQPVTGVYSAAAPGDTVSVRYMTSGGDGILNCSGLSNPAGGANTLYVNQFNVTAGAGGGQLICTMNGTAYTLVSGVTNLSVLYGVKTNLAATGNNVDTYLTAAQMSASNWTNVITALVKLTFTNPMYSQAGQGQAPTITVQRVVNLMNQSGPST